MLLGGCNSKRCTSPLDRGPFLIKEYFPLNQGDQWIWEIVRVSEAEPFADGDINLGEPFIDTSKNGVYDPGEPYEDWSHNGRYDGPNDPWIPGVPYDDRNSNGVYDPPNGRWDEGEYFVDLDSNGRWSWFLDTSGLKAEMGGRASISSDGSDVFGRRSRLAVSAPPGWYSVDHYTDDGFSNDSLGLRWHSHSDGNPFSRKDDLKDRGPIIIATERIEIGDSVVSADTSDSSYATCSWTSVFKGVERVMVPAGDFRNCLRFKSVASRWHGNMAKYNGTSYQWYAKNVGLVRSEGPGEGEYWMLKSASVGGTSYP
jgi:hypothetical protein